MKLAALAYLACGPALLACVNEYNPNTRKLTNAFQQGENALLALQTPKPVRPWLEVRRELEVRLSKARTQQTLNDLAVVYMRFNEPTWAIPLLEELEQRFPNLYQTAANLGTAYELAGRNEDALKWIKEGMRRNPQSHYGTEWVHVRILEAKLALAKDPQWLETHRVSGITVDPQTKQPVLPQGQTPTTAWQALQYQLRERLPFSPEKDEIVSQLLADYAYLTSVLLKTEFGVGPIYRMAARYSSAHAQDLEQKALATLQSAAAPNTSPTAAVQSAAAPNASPTAAVQR
jgi:tetratricopeptide (TPR) repeat protein